MSIKLGWGTALVVGGIAVGLMGGALIVLVNLSRTDRGVSIELQTGVDQRRRENLETFQQNFPVPQSQPSADRPPAIPSSPVREPFIAEAARDPKCDLQPEITYLEMESNRFVQKASLEPGGTRVFQIGASPSLQGKRVSLKLNALMPERIQMALSSTSEHDISRISPSICEQLKEPQGELQFSLSTEPHFLYLYVEEPQSMEIILGVLSDNSSPSNVDDAARMADAPELPIRWGN